MAASTPVVVTGGAGFIGANLCRTLLERGHERIVVIDDLSTGHRSNLDGLAVELVEASILDTDALARAVRPGSVVVHLAALGSVPRSVADPITSHGVNATGTMLVLEAARAAGSPQVVLASSSSVYGDNDAPAKHEGLPAAPKSPYGASKLAAEAYTLAHQRTYGMGVLAFRFFNVFGPLQTAGHVYAAVVPSFVDRALRGRPLVIHGDGKQSRDFTYVGTVCATIAEAVERRVTFDGPVNLAFGTQIPLLEIIDLIAAEVGTELEVEMVDPRAGDIRHSKADPTRLRSLFPDIEPVGVGRGIADTVAWFRSLPAYPTPTDR
ncbi:MAG: NAD-dependent epimerase/dehydratase family protein [Acidimicrobiales bacterium]